MKKKKIQKKEVINYDHFEPTLDVINARKARHNYYYRNSLYVALILIILGIILTLYDIIYFSIEGVSIMMALFNMINYFAIELSGFMILILSNVIKWGNSITYLKDLTRVSLYVVLCLTIIHIFVQSYYLDTDPAGLPELIIMIAIVIVGFPYAKITAEKIGKITDKIRAIMELEELKNNFVQELN